MKHKTHLLLLTVAALIAGSSFFTSCGEEEPQEHHYTEYDDSTGLEITDSIIVIFDGKQWKSLTYEATIEQQQFSAYRWANITAHKPGSKYPAFKLRIFLEPGGNHTNHRIVSDPGVGYTIPGALTGDAQGGALLYYEKGEIKSPDGTRTGDWWPLDLTTSVLKYNNDEKKLTARVTATMFDYRSWVDREVTNVEECRTCNLSITFGGLPL